MNEHVPDSDEFESIERQLKSLRPTEIPAIVQARLQFELGRRQGKREARRSMTAFAAAACLVVWAGTTWIERTNATDPTVTMVQSGVPSSDPTPQETTPGPAWTLDDIQRIARYEAAALGDSQYGDRLGSRASSSTNSDDETETNEGPWNHQRWLKELMAESYSISS